MTDLTRRALLQGGALGVLGLGPLPRFLMRAAQAQDRGGSRKVLVAVFQRGAVDGLSMVVPHGDRAYYDARPTIGIRRPVAGDPGTAIELDGFFGLHPSLGPLEPLWEARRLAVVHACGSPDPTRSHFDAQRDMESGTPGVRTTPDGWLARSLRGRSVDRGSAFRSVAIGTELPRSLRGDAGAVALSSLRDFDVRMSPGEDARAPGVRTGFEALYEGGVGDLLHRSGREAFQAVRALRAARPERISPAHGAEYPRSRFGDSLRQIAQLIKGDVGLEVGFTDSGGWDTHVGQGDERGQLADRLRDLALGLAAFDRDLGDRMGDVVVLTMSEFGRTLRENGNRGTDHGHGTAMLVLGGPVRGGRVLGDWPGVGPADLFEARDLAVTTDFRHLFGELAVRHLGVPAGAPLFPGFEIRREAFPGLLA